MRTCRLVKRLFLLCWCALATFEGVSQSRVERDSTRRYGWKISIEQVDVVGTRPMKKIGTQETAIATRVLHDNIASQMADALKFGTSIYVKEYGRATLSTVSFRGTSPSHTQVTWNGMKINSPMLGMVDFSMIPSYFIDDASLLHGTSSVNITGGGLGGAVLLATKPADAQGCNLQFVQGVGMFKTFDEYLRFTYGGERWHSSTRVVFSSSPNDFKYKNYHKKLNIYDDGHNIVSQYNPVERNKSGDFRDLHLLQEVYYNRGDGNRFGLNIWYLNSDRGLPMLDVDYRENAGYSNKQREHTLRSVVSWDHVRKNWKAGGKAGYIRTWMAYDFEKDKGNGEWEKMIRSRSKINTFYVQAEGEYSIGRKLLVTATLSAHQHLVHTTDKNVLDSLSAQHLGQIPSNEQGDVKLAAVGYDEGRTELEGCVSVKWRPWERLGLALTLREQMYGSEWTPVIPAFFADVVLSKKGNIIAKASISRNYRFPTLNDLFFLPGGNIHLKKEHGFTYDGGVEFTVGRKNSYSLHGEATWFDSYIDDWIIWLPTFKGFWSPSNIKRVHAYGIELKGGLDWIVATDWRLLMNGNFSWTPSINHGDPVSWGDASIGKQLVYVPEFSSAVHAQIEWKTWSLGYKWCHYSERFTTSSNEIKTKIYRISPYFMSDVTLEKRFGTRWANFSAKALVRNIFDEEYQSVLQRPMPGINFELFLEIRPKWGNRK